MPAMIRYLDHWVTAAPSRTKIEVARWRNVNPSVIQCGGSTNDSHALPQVWMTDICHCAQEEIEPLLWLISDLPSLQALEGLYQNQPCVKGFTNVIFKRGEQPFVSRSRHAIGGNAYSGPENMSIGRVINERLFSLRMSPGLASKAIADVVSFKE
ncbi:hypothetical protein TNCV_1123381 [Trichonephila clavipes]|uniref:Uncharacterized protein n=1 Tax=Trichonephila clavipes TaxID=2585209 RepID=A0A8X6SEN3_TRICX|nr:hypothetical protein TNCV_1123381 [Trichonephila clavipes]